MIAERPPTFRRAYLGGLFSTELVTGFVFDMRPHNVRSCTYVFFAAVVMVELSGMRGVEKPSYRQGVFAEPRPLSNSEQAILIAKPSLFAIA